MDETDGLTREDIAALAGADEISFHTYKGVAEVVGYLRSYGNRIYTAREQRLYPDTGPILNDRSRRVTVQHAAHGYDSDVGMGWRFNQYPDYSAFVSYVNHDVWATITRAMRPDDVVTLLWTADNNNGNITAVDYHQDELKIRLERGHDRDVRRTFLVAVSVGPDNSARMIRRDA